MKFFPHGSLSLSVLRHIIGTQTFGKISDLATTYTGKHCIVILKNSSNFIIWLVFIAIFIKVTV